MTIQDQRNKTNERTRNWRRLAREKGDKLTSKQCIMCNIEKHITHFSRDTDYLDGYRKKCIDCKNLENRQTHKNKVGSNTDITETEIVNPIYWKKDFKVLKELRRLKRVNDNRNKNRINSRLRAKDVYIKSIQKALTKNITVSYFRSIKNGARLRNLEFTITAEYIQELLEKQKFKCKYSGVDLKCEVNSYVDGKNTNTASLDRIDSNKGYIVGNVQWVHKTINIMKWESSEEEFMSWCIRVAENRTCVEVAA